MSKSLKKTGKFHYTPKSKFPSLTKYKTTWDLKGLYYKSAKDPQIEEDIRKTEQAYCAFAKHWEKADITLDATRLKQALSEYEKLTGMSEAARPGRYFGLRKAVNVGDTEADRALALLSERLRKASDQVLFFTLNLGKLSKERQKELLLDPELEHFHYFLRCVFEGAKHDLSLPEEKIIRLKSRQSNSMWCEAVEKIISQRTIKWKGSDLPLPEALETIDLLKTADKKKLWQLIIVEMEKIGEVAEHEINAIVVDARGEDDLRGYTKPYSATALGYEHDEKSIEKLVEAVSDKGFALSRKFYRLKAKYHKVKSLHYTQKYESIGQDLEIPFVAAVSICRDVFYGVKKEYGEIFDQMLKKGQIDVFPTKGKRGGAFMSSETGQPTQVFLNHMANFKSLETLAHEMGHAIHSERSKIQSPFYDGHSIVTAETASTLFENLVFDAVLAAASPKDQMTLLHDRIARDISTIERQVAFFNCELEIHNTIRKQGAMHSAELADCMYRHLKSYLGPAVELNKKDGYSYVYIPHLRYGFYVYTYAFGILMSTIMANRYKENNDYIEEIDRFLVSGSSDTVVNIFKSIGIDTTKENTFLDALDNQAADIASFEKLLKKKR